MPEIIKKILSHTAEVIFAMLIITAVGCSSAACSRSSSYTELSAAQDDAADPSDVRDDAADTDTEDTSDTETAEDTNSLQGDNAIMDFHSVDLTKAYKISTYTNPLITQHFGADPYAMEYDGRLYIYMTADAFETDAEGNIKDNSYGSIRSIYVISTDDMINFTDHGEIRVAGSTGAATWANNSWAPAACWKEIDGQDRFFLYFADNGGGIGVLVSDSPTGPFTDPLGHALISRSTPNCSDVVWLFDPAVLVDDDGSAYLYFGGGVPEGQAADPGTGRAVRLGSDMISLDTDPVTLDVPYLFEDSGIHKYNGRYYYTYCTNWQVDAAGTAEYGFNSGEIACLVSDSPLGPFTYSETILQNPGRVFGLYGNNHHCVFSFQGEWYITYHARTLEQKMGIEKGYRSTHIDRISIAEDGTIGSIRMTNDGRSQLKYVDSYSLNPAVSCSLMAGTSASPADASAKYYGSGSMYLDSIDAGDYIKVTGVDFGQGSGLSLTVSAASPNGEAELYFVLDLPKNTPTAGIRLEPSGSEEFTEYTIEVPDISGIHDLYIVCASGSGAQMMSWQFSRR